MFVFCVPKGVVVFVEVVVLTGPDGLLVLAFEEVIDDELARLVDVKCFSNISLSVLHNRPSSLRANSSPGANCLLHIQQRKHSM